MDSKQSRFLVMMPAKFRKKVWFKRGSFLIVDKIDNVIPYLFCTRVLALLIKNHCFLKIKMGKVQGKITSVLQPFQIKYLKTINEWSVNYIIIFYTLFVSWVNNF